MNTAVWHKIDQSARNLTPFLLSLVLVVLTVLPSGIPSLAPVAPPLALMSIYHWTVYRPNQLPVVGVFAIGILHDLLSGAPLGLFTLVFLTAYGVTLTQRRFVAGKSFLIYWFGFALIAAGASLESWVFACAWTFSLLDPNAMIFQYLVTIGLFPLFAGVFLRWQQALLPLE
jgi:rod shape-determining protein MreD